MFAATLDLQVHMPIIDRVLHSDAIHKPVYHKENRPCGVPHHMSMASAQVFFCCRGPRDLEIDLLEAEAARRRGLPAAVAAVQLRAAAAVQGSRYVLRAAAAQQRPHHVPHLRTWRHRMLTMARTAGGSASGNHLRSVSTANKAGREWLDESNSTTYRSHHSWSRAQWSVRACR